MTRLHNLYVHWLDHLTAPEDRRRTVYLAIMNLILMAAAVMLMIYTRFNPNQLGSLALNFALSACVFLLVLFKRFHLAVKLFTLTQPAINFITLPFLDLNSIVYTIPWFLSVTIFIKRRSVLIFYGCALNFAMIISAILTHGNPRYAALTHTDVFLFAIVSIGVLTFTALIATGDMEQLREQSRTLETSEQQMRAILDNFPGFITVYDPKLRAIALHAAPSLMPPSLIQPFVGTHITQHCTPEQLTVIQPRLERLFVIGKPITFEMIGWEAHRWYEVSIAPVVEKGVVKRAVTIMVEITRRKRAEAAQETASHALQDFAYIISHDLKAPMRGISTVAEWLVEDYADKFDDKGRELVDMLQGRVRLTDSMINGVLEYSRIGRQETVQPVDLNLVIQEIDAVIVPPDRARLILETPLPTINSDPTRMRQVFQNLIDNAVKYGDKPMTEIRISAVELLNGWSFTIADNGRGIPEQHYERIFQMYQTFAPRDNETSTGIGLTILKKIMDYYGGTIHLHSEVGVGTSFTLTLPTVVPERTSISP